MTHRRIIELSTTRTTVTVPACVEETKIISQMTQGNIPVHVGTQLHLEELKPKISPMTNEQQTHVYLLAGSAAGIMEHCLMYPVDSVKTRMQSLHPHPNASYRNIKHAFCKIVKTEGILRAVRGINIVALGAGPAHALYFTSYESTKKLLEGKIYGGEHVSVALAAAVATFFHDATMNPVEVIKQRIQVYDSPYKGVYQCARGVIKNEGVAAFYRSFSTSLTMNLPFQCLHFLTYEIMKKILNPNEQYNWKAHLISGGVAGGLAAGLTSPFDVARTLLNTQERCVLMQCSGNTNKITGMVNAFRTIYSMHGVRGYFRGVTARVLFQIPSTAISWSVYEFFKHNLSLQITEEEMMDLTL